MGDQGDEDAGGDEEHGPKADLLAAMQDTLATAVSIEPARGGPTAGQVEELRLALETVAGLIGPALAATDEESLDEIHDMIALVYARCAVVAIAADDGHAKVWLATADEHAADDGLRGEISAAVTNPERYRQLVHGRNQFAHGQERPARKLWKELVKSGDDDAIAHAARVELKAPRALRPGDSPTLWQTNGFGIAFCGSRDPWPDGSYATTHCLTALWIPLIPMRAYRVHADGEGYVIIAREQLSAFARIARLVLLFGVVLGITSVILHGHFTDPTRVAKHRFERVLSTAETADPETALRDLDGELARDDGHLDSGRAQRAGAAIIRLTAGFVKPPFTPDHLDQASRLVRRYQGLPEIAQGGAAREAVVTALDGWIGQLGDKPATAEARLTLLRHAATVGGRVEGRIATARLAVARSKQAEWPVEALALLVVQPDRDSIALADEIVERLVASPSVLLDAPTELDAWANATAASALRDRVSAQRAIAAETKDQVADEKLPAAKLAELAKQRPWDQLVAVRLARDEAAAGKLAPAFARLEKIGKPGMMTRDARLLLGQLASALGKLEEADVLLSSLLGARLERFVAASAKLDEALKAAQARIKADLDIGVIPDDVRRRYDTLSTDEQRGELIRKWASDTITADATVTAARDAYLVLSDIVPVSLAAGTVKLRRAQAMPDGPARNAMLLAAERSFLAIRNEAEGQPEFRVGLGEIYARLGKVKESEAELGALLEKNEPELSMLVARTYRTIGSVERARAIAKQVYETAPAGPEKHKAAVMLGLLASGVDEDESEGWFRKADQSNAFVRTSLLEIEGHRLLRQGKRAECGAKFAQAAKEHLANANATSIDGYNNAAVAEQARFRCTGDMKALADATAAFEKAYRASRESAIVVGNFASNLDSNGRLRVIGKRIDLRVFQPTRTEVDRLIDSLLDSPERDAVLADLAADPDIRRGEQVFTEYEVLAPNNPLPYTTRFHRAIGRRDVAGATAVVERARKAKGLDTSETAGTRKKWASGELDDKLFQSTASRLAQLEAVSKNTKIDAKTRAAAQYLFAAQASQIGPFKADTTMLQAARAAAIEAMRLWPALGANLVVVDTLIDEAALGGDAKAWIALRRETSAIQALDKLIAERSPIATSIKGSALWSQVLGFARADARQAGIDELRLARVLGDAALETRAKAALDDKLVRLAIELALVLDPDNAVSKADLAYLDRR